MFNEDAKWNNSENKEKIVVDQEVQTEDVNVDLEGGSSPSSTTSNPTNSSESASSDEDTPPTKLRSLVEMYESTQFALVIANPTSFHEAIQKKE